MLRETHVDHVTTLDRGLRRRGQIVRIALAVPAQSHTAHVAQGVDLAFAVKESESEIPVVAWRPHHRDESRAVHAQLEWLLDDHRVPATARVPTVAATTDLRETGVERRFEHGARIPATEEGAKGVAARGVRRSLGQS